jgi:hypothetical protein
MTIRYTLVNETDQPIEVSLTTNGGGKGSTVDINVAAGKSNLWDRMNGHQQMFTVKVEGVTRQFGNKNAGSHYMRKSSNDQYILA